jgi:transposase-like protein
MPRYSQEKKDYALSLMSPPNNQTVAEVSKRTGVTEPTLYAWRNQARVAGRAVPADGNAPDGWRPEDKFAAVVEAMGLAEAELGEYCRKKGLHVAQIVQWRAACMQGISGGGDRVNATTLAEERRHSRELERELRRKEKALAEAAALLVLTKKLEAFHKRRDEDA